MKYIFIILISILSLNADQFKLSDIKGGSVLAISDNYRIIANYRNNKVFLMGPDGSKQDLSVYGYDGGGLFGINNYGEFLWSSTEQDGSYTLHFANRKNENLEIKNAFGQGFDANLPLAWDLNNKGEFRYITSEYAADNSKVTYKLNTFTNEGKTSSIDIPENLIGSGPRAAFEEDLIYLQSEFYPNQNDYSIVKRKYFVFKQETGFVELDSESLDLDKYILADSNNKKNLALIGEDQKIVLVKYNEKNSKLKLVKKFSYDLGSNYADLALNDNNEIVASVAKDKAPFYGSDLVYLRGNKATDFLCSFRNSAKVKYAGLLSATKDFFHDSRKFLVYTAKEQFANVLTAEDSQNWCVDATVKVIGTCAEYFDENLRHIKNFPKTGMRCSFEVKLKDSRGKPLSGLTSAITRNNQMDPSRKDVIASAITDINGKAILKITFEQLEVFNDTYFIHAPYADKNYRTMEAFIGNFSGV